MKLLPAVYNIKLFTMGQDKIIDLNGLTFNEDKFIIIVFTKINTDTLLYYYMLC